MAKFLNTRKAVSEIEDLIRNAHEKLILISPYLKLSQDFKELLTYRNKKEKITNIVFGKQELNPDELNFLQSLQFVSLKYNENLHAKCYLNDEKMIITSLNLYAFSMANNKEMGVLIDKSNEADIELFNDAMKEVDFIIDTSQKFELNSPKPIFHQTKETVDSSYRSAFDKKAESKSNKGSLRELLSNPSSGFCIRTGAEIPFNIEMPLCKEALKSWNKYKDKDYEEYYCHFTGEKSNGHTSFSKPILSKNWKEAKKTHNL